MKNVFLLSTILFLLSTNGFTQDNDRKGFTSFSLGSSIPTGQFGSTNYSTGKAGYASGGLTIDFSVGHKIKKNLGLTAIFRSQANGVNTEAYAYDRENYFRAYNQGKTAFVDIQSSSYSLGGIMAGVYGAFPIEKKFSIEPRLLVGFSVATLPSMTTVTYESGTKLTTFIREQSGTFAFSYIIGCGANYDISKKICMMINFDYYSANAEWENVEEIGIGHVTGTTTNYTYDYSQKFSTINLNAGLGFKF